MAKKSLKPAEDKPLDYFSQVKAAQKQEKTDSSTYTPPLRRDMIPSSNIQPARESVVHRESLRVATGILLGIVITCLVLFYMIGPGRPQLEQSLALLADNVTTRTPTSTSTSIPPTATLPPPTATPIPPTLTPSLTPTSRATRTPVVAMLGSPTPPRTSTATTPACRDVLTITLADVGQTLCVKGIVINIVSKPSAFMLIFSSEPGAFYWASYDLVWSRARVNYCYQITGKIDQMGNNPILIFDYTNLPEECQ